MEIAIKCEHQHWSLPMLNATSSTSASATELGSALNATYVRGTDGPGSMLSATAAASAADDLFGGDVTTPTKKTPKLELQSGSGFFDMSPTGMNSNSGMLNNNSSALSDNSPGSSSSSAAMVAAAAAFMQASATGLNNSLLGRAADMSNGLGGRANSLSLSDGGGSGGGTLNGSRNALAGGSGIGTNPVGDTMQPRQRRKVPEGELCAVCSDRATGYHYGVASCNGCKTFFRRTIVSEHTFVCQYQGNCDVNKNVRCACRHCRFNKCVAVGMDARAIQNDRDRIGPTKKFRLSLVNVASGGSSTAAVVGGAFGSASGVGLIGKQHHNGSMDEDQLSISSLSPSGTIGGGNNGMGGGMGSMMSAGFGINSMVSGLNSTTTDNTVIEKLMVVEELTNKLRNCVLDECKTAREMLLEPSLLYKVSELELDKQTMYKELYPASMNDIQMWNIRELRLCLEWAKTFEEFTRLSENDQFSLVRNVAFMFNLMNRVFYSIDHGPDQIVFPNGAFVLRQPQEQVRIPGCRSIYHRQMDEIMIPFRRMGVTTAEFATFKAILLFNPDACDLSRDVKDEIARERSKYLQALFYLIVNNNGLAAGLQKYGNILMMAPTLQNIIDQNDENMQVMEVFGNFWRINSFVKELCMK